MATGFLDRTTSSPSVADENALYEVVNGERVELPSMSVYSSLVAGRMFVCLDAFLNKSPIGTPVIETLLILDAEANLRRRPDVAFVSAERWPLDREIPEEGDWAVVPTLAVEVTSPHDLFHEVHAKVREYFEHGVNEVWVVIPEERQVYVYHSPTDVDIHNVTRTLPGGDILPGFELPLANLFRRTTAVPN